MLQKNIFGLTPETPFNSATAIELWGGIECTVNRVGDEYFDQIERSGHAARLEDLQLFAELGVRALRYPVLWERVAPDGLDKATWTWTDERLSRLRDLNIRPIVGLVHHGSGPRHTSLLDSKFPEQLASYARAVAERYPWIENYTPVNEPLTTARFSGLYGHWYPHKCEALSFARALLMQCRATVLSMRAIRQINPQAQLIQTEDLGKTFSTRRLAYQAEFENERRWLSFDLLAGRVNASHAMWSYLKWVGVDEAELAWFVDNPCPPDIIGINHYLTSERFLDQRLERYPAHTHGGNGQDAYADVEAVRVAAEGPAGPYVLLKEAWQRYRLPVAITEAHLGCTREEQMRWLKEVWEAAFRLRSEGADIRAVTAWSLLGAYDWHNLLTRREDRYEPGVFDLRSSVPRPTALVRMLRDLSAGREHDHPALDAPGWWRRLDRFQYPPVTNRQHDAVAPAIRGVSVKGKGNRTLLITGATGTLGRAFARICEMRGLPYRLLTRREMDIADARSVEAVLAEHAPWAIINTAGYVRVDEAETDAVSCFRENTLGPKILAAACERHKSALVTFSSDLVFDGNSKTPYVETDACAPLNVYGQSKAAAEREVLASLSSALVIRTSAFFGPWDEHNFVTQLLRALSASRTFVAASDAVISPTYVPDLVHACLDLLIDGESGVWHLANKGTVTWSEFALEAARMAGLEASGIEARPTKALRLAAPRPLYSPLGSERGLLLPSLDDALGCYIRDCELWREQRVEEQKPRARAAAAGAK